MQSENYEAQDIAGRGAFAAKRAGYATEPVDTDNVQSGSLRACNARTLEKLQELHVNTIQLADIIGQLGGNDGPGNPVGRGGLDQKEPPEPSAPIFQARRIEQRLEQQIDIQRNLINKLRSLIG